MKKLKSALLISLLTSSPCLAAKPDAWEAQVPKVVGEASAWIPFLEELNRKDFPMTTFAAASRMVVFFKDLPAKEAAYRSVIRLVDRGFPYSVQGLFLPADIVPAGDSDFVDAYNIYKSVLNQDRGMEAWAKNYAAALDQKESPKYHFYQALLSYEKKDYAAAETSLRAILAKDQGPERASLVKKAARTLGRMYFDQQKHEDAYKVYEGFLLKSNPIQPSDWLEAAWNLYHLKRYQESLGMLYNLESASALNAGNLEKYTLRGLLYRKLCAFANAEKLLESFNEEFGKSLNGIRMGEPLTRHSQLIKLDVPANQEFRQLSALISGLKAEEKNLDRLSGDSRRLAEHVIQTEMRHLARKRRPMVDAALRQSAEKLILMSEHLKFLQFDVQREKFNPNVVFQETSLTLNKPVEDLPNKGYRIHWRQLGDFWRDERNHFQAALGDQCETR